MKEERVKNSIKIIVTVTILSTIIYLIKYAIAVGNPISGIVDTIEEATNNQVTDNNNGVYVYKESINGTKKIFSSCSITYINNYILVINDNYYKFRSSCMGTYDKGSGKTSELDFTTNNDSSYITLDEKKYNKDDTVKKIEPYSISGKMSQIELSSLTLLLKETEIEDNYYKIDTSINGNSSGIKIKVLYDENTKKFNLTLYSTVKTLYTLELKDDYSNMPLFYTYGKYIVVIDKDSNNSIYQYKFRVFSNEKEEYNLENQFPIQINNVTLNSSNSIYIKYVPSDKSFKVIVGNDKKFCKEESTSKNPIYYEFKITFNSGDAAFTKPEYVKTGYESDGCNYINTIIGSE